MFYLYSFLRFFDLHHIIGDRFVNNNAKIVNKYFKDLHHIYFLWLFAHGYINIEVKDTIIKNIDSISNEDLYVASYFVFSHNSVLRNRINVDFTREYVKSFNLQQLESFNFYVTRGAKR